MGRVLWSGIRGDRTDPLPADPTGGGPNRGEPKCPETRADRRPAGGGGGIRDLGPYRDRRRAAIVDATVRSLEANARLLEVSS